MDAYSISKLCGELTARGFAARFGIDIYILRIGAVIAPDEYHTHIFQSYITNPEKWEVHGWSYTDARDLGSMVHCCIERDGLGYQIFNAVNNSITNEEGESSEVFLGRVCLETPVRRVMRGREAPICNGKIRGLLGWEEMWDWRVICLAGAGEKEEMEFKDEDEDGEKRVETCEV